MILLVKSFHWKHIRAGKKLRMGDEEGFDEVDAQVLNQ